MNYQYSNNFPQNFVLPSTRREFIKYENNPSDSHYQYNENPLNRKYSDNFMMHFEDSDSSNQEFQGIEKQAGPGNEMLIVETYHNANTNNMHQSNNNYGQTSDRLKGTSKIREFQNDDEKDLQDNEYEDNRTSKRKEKEEKEVKSKPVDDNKKKNHNLTFKVKDLMDDAVQGIRAVDEVKEAARIYLKVLRAKLNNDTSKEIFVLFEIFKNARFEGIEKFEELTKNTRGSKGFHAGMNSLKAFMNEKEEFVSQINDNVAAAECQEFLDGIISYLNENISNGQFPGDKSIMDEISDLLFQYDAKNQGILKCQVLNQNLKPILEGTFEALLQNEKEHDNNFESKHETQHHHKELEEEYLTKISKLEDQNFHLETKLKGLEREKNDDNLKISQKFSPDELNRLKEQHKVLKEENMKLETQIKDKIDAEVQMKKEIILLRQKIDNKKKGCVLI